MSVVKILISPSRKFNAISLITNVYHVINKEVADSKPYVIKVALDHFILLTGIWIIQEQNVLDFLLIRQV